MKINPEAHGINPEEMKMNAEARGINPEAR